MDIIKMARELGKTIQESEAYITYAACKQQNDEDEGLQKLIGDFNLLRMSLGNEISKPEDQKDKDKIQALNSQLNDCYTSIMENENMIKFNNAKEAIDTIMNQITMILGMTVEGEDPMTCEVEHNCSGSCSTCGGCH